MSKLSFIVFVVRYYLRRLTAPIRWLRMVRPWCWRPLIKVYSQADWFWEFGFTVYIDWAVGHHFDAVGLSLGYGPKSICIGLKDND